MFLKYILLHGIFIWGSIFIGIFFLNFVSTMNGGELPQPQEPDFHLGDLPFEPSPDRAGLCYPNPSIV
jgi:hypothetical protein